MTAIEHRFGPYGGQYVPETLVPALVELEAAWIAARDDPAYQAELNALLNDYVGRPSPLYLAQRGFRRRSATPVYLKREDLNHTGAHKINNALGQALLAKRMGKTRIIAETGAGSHGVAIATACALLGLDCIVYMGTEDMRRQAPNVQRMGLLGATVAPVDAGRPHAQGGRQRRDPRLGRQRRQHALRDRLVRRPGAVPRARARPAADHRRRGARADPREDRRAARPRDRLRRRRLERDRHLRARSSTTRASSSSASRPRARGSTAAATARRSPSAVAAASCTAPTAAIMQDEDGQILEAHSISRRPGLSRHRPRARLAARHRPRALLGVTDDEALERVPAPRRARGHHPGARVRACRRLGARRGAAETAADTIDLSACPAAATRTSPRRSTSWA